MSNQEAAILDLGNNGDLDNVGSQLEFQDFSHLPQSTSTTTANFSQISSDDPHHQGADDDGDDVSLLKNKSKQNVAPFWELAYFANYFDITTNKVLERIGWSIIPNLNSKASNKSNYIERHIKNNPDFYGPLWVNVTLIFLIAICGNISAYLTSSPDTEWHYNFNKVGLAASTITTYTTVVPIVLWFFCWFRGCTHNYTLLETLCAYGYSTSVYIPISLLWMLGIKLIQYVLVVVGSMTSGLVLLLAFKPVFESDPSHTAKLSYLLLLLIIASHGFVAFTFLRYFY